jgi:hypothetical protein
MISVVSLESVANILQSGRYLGVDEHGLFSAVQDKNKKLSSIDVARRVYDLLDAVERQINAQQQSCDNPKEVIDAVGHVSDAVMATVQRAMQKSLLIQLGYVFSGCSSLQAYAQWKAEEHVKWFRDKQKNIQESLVADFFTEHFWESEIEPFEIRHGTNCLYLSFFKKYGISTAYPPAQEALVQSIRTIWARHEKDLMPKTEYFTLFEERYDAARKKNKIEVHFSANPISTQQFTTGSRANGEWISQVRQFLYEAKQKPQLFTEEERQSLKKFQAFIDLLDKLPALTVHIHADCPEVPQGFWNRYFVPKKKFKKIVWDECGENHSVVRVTGHLMSSVLPGVRAKILYAQQQYEQVVSFPVKPENLRFKVIQGVRDSERQPLPLRYPKVAVGTLVTLPVADCLNLRVHPGDGFSDLPEYNDSSFTITPLPSDCSSVTVLRRLRTEKEQLLAREIEERVQMRLAVLHDFDSEDLALKYDVTRE